MPRRVFEENDWEGDGADRLDDDLETTVPCPYCKEHIPEDTPRCPYCEKYISEEEDSPSRKPWWIIIGAVICLCVVYQWIVNF